MANMNSQPSPNIPSLHGSVESLGVHAEELSDNLKSARIDSVFTPLMINAGVLGEQFAGSKIIPGVTYGIDATKPKFKQIELLPGTGSLLTDTPGTSYFNPHLSIRTRAQNLTNSMIGKGKDRVRGTTFGLPSYVLLNREGKHLFIGGNESDLEEIDEEHAHSLSKAYEIGSVVVGDQVMKGKVEVDLKNTSLPTIVREIGQNITKISEDRSQRAHILRGTKDALAAGKSPDYRSYLSAKKGWPKGDKNG